MSLVTVSRNLVVQASQPLAVWIAQALAPLVIPSLQKEFQAMSATLAEAVSNLQAVAQRAEAAIQAAQAESANDKAAIASLQQQLAAAQAGDPAAITAIDSVAAALDQVAPAPAPAPQPDPATDTALPQG